MSRRRGYKFTNKRHTRKGLLSSGIGFFVLLLMSGLFYLAYRQQGEIGAYVGVIGFLAMLASVIGLHLGVKSLREEDSFHFFSYVGSIGNGLLLVAWIILYVLGM